jgi:hypothetical protein
MKTSYMVLLLLFSSMGTSAQPILNASDFPENYSAVVYTINNTGLSPGNSGKDQVWDFSNLTLPFEPAGSYIVVPPWYSPDIDAFPTANFCAEISFIDLVGPDEIYYMYNITPTAIEFLGTSSYWGVVLYTDPYIYFQFPYFFGSTISDTYIDNFSAVSSMSSSYDAYGTLITPFGTYTDVIRDKRTENGNTYYRWFTTNPFSILMEGNFSTNGLVHIFNNTTVLSVNENNKMPFAVYPNPANSTLNVQFPANATFDKIIITDLAGKTVIQQVQNLNQVTIQDLAKGIYIIHAFAGDDPFRSKFIKE